MARTSKRYLKQKPDEKQAKTYYRAGIYTRLSNERSESWREKSSSIETQVLNCKEYAIKENIEVVEVFTDYEYSGTNFERPAFIEMMDAIKTRKINCIIIRDLSRLGREHLEMGRLIDKVFPFLGVRFISVSDKVDTVKDTDSKKSFEITLKNIVNDMYSKDISVKIITSKHNRAKNGYFIGSVAPYGYKINKLKEGQKLVVDEKVRFIVEEMFALSLDGKSQLDIARIFNHKGYATALTYIKTGRIYREAGDPEWNKSSVGKMLLNKSYSGTLVQGVKQQNLAKGIKQRIAPKSDHIIFENAHEAIISKEVHERILAERLERKNNSYFSNPKRKIERDYDNRYKNLIVDVKGNKFHRRYRLDGVKHDKISYLFVFGEDTGKTKLDKKVFIMEKDLDELIVEKISELLNKLGRKDRLIERISTRFDKANVKLDKDIAKLSKKLEKEELSIQKSYEKYSLGKLDRDSYKLKRDIYNSRIDIINDEIVAIKSKAKEFLAEKEKTTEWIDNLFKAEGIEKLPSELIHELIDKILVHETHNFEVVFKFKADDIKEARYE